MNTPWKPATIFLSLVVVVLSGLLIKEQWFSPPPQLDIAMIRPIAELATVEYTTVIEMSQERVPNDIRRLFGAREYILMLVYGNVKAGFDLNKISEEDIQTNGQQVRLVLPRPEILSLSVDNERTHVVYYDRSWFVGQDIELESETLRMAERALRQQALEDEILQKARVFGVLFMENYLRSLGFTDIEIVVR